MSNGDKESKSWWSTVPGTITAVATLITAIGGLIIILKSVGVFKTDSPTVATQNISQTTDTNKVITPQQSAQQISTIHLESTLILRYPFSYDLDAGMPYNSENSNADADFMWEHPTSMDYELRPDLGKFSLLGKEDFESITLQQLQKLDYSKNSINADELLKGVVIGVITKEKRFGKFVVQEPGLEPSIKVVIYNKDDE
jgi:hypothetical protein